MNRSMSKVGFSMSVQRSSRHRWEEVESSVVWSHLQQQLRRWVRCSDSGGHWRTDSVQLLDLPPPHLA